MILVVDNYDSFTYNLVQIVAQRAPLTVARNDAENMETLIASARGVIVSPGPGRPEQTGALPRLLPKVLGRVPVLGVCLGHQLLGILAGAKVVKVPPVHGKTSIVRHDGEGVYEGIEGPFEATRYHSLAIAPESLAPPWRITAWADDGTVMGIRSQDSLSEGVQFHPESIATGHGPDIIENFLRRCLQ